jgi:hypothetical protein
MPIDFDTLRAAVAAGASADVILAMVEVQSAKDERAAVAAAKKIETHREKDRKYQRGRRQASKSADIGRVLPKSADVDRHRTTSIDAAANPPPVAGPPSAEPPGIESVDKMVEVAEQGLTDQRKSPPIPPFKESVSFLPMFTDSLHFKEKKEVDTRAREVADSLFAKFWAVYPHKVGKRDAANCFQRVIKSGIVGIDDLMSGLARYVAKTDDRPWCNPATWLNGGRWDDQPAVANGATNGGGNRDRAGNGTHHPKTFAEYAHQLVTEIARDRAARDRAG